MEKGSDYDHVISEFKRQYGIKKVIAFSGGSDSKLNSVPDGDPLQKKFEEFSKALEDKIISDCIGKFRGYRIAVLTGGTKWGVPHTASLVAKKYGLKTIGIYPLAGKKHALGDDILDLSICVPPTYSESKWGDESPVFAKLLDGVVVYGGNAGTLIECAHVLKINETLKKSGESLKYIVPISGTGGVADGLPFIWAKPEIRAACMPSLRVVNGFQAADILRDQLELDDYLDRDINIL